MINKKRTILIVLVIFISLSLLLYVNQYTRHVSSAPESHKEARKDYVNAMMIHFAYFTLIKAGIDFQNPILSPLKKARDYFYYKGIKKLPKNDAEKAIWFHVFELGPYNISVKGKYGYLLSDYGRAYGEKFLEDTFKYIILLADHEVIDKENKDMSRFVVQSFFDLFTVYTSERSVDSSLPPLHKENIRLFVKDKSLVHSFMLLYDSRAKFVKKYNINDFIKKDKKLYGNYHKFYNDLIYVSSMILFSMIEEHKKYDCKKSKKYFKDIYISKQKIREFFKAKNASKDIIANKEKVFIRLKIPNKQYDNKHSDNPFKMYVNCNYDDIFIKEGN